MLGSGISARRKQAVMSRLAGLLRRLLFGLPAASLDTRSTPSGPTAGQVYTFETLPVYETSPAETARFAALKIIGVVRGCVILAVLNKTGATPPALFQARRGNVLIKNAFEWGGCPAVFGVPLASWTPERDLRKFHLLGCARVSGPERRYLADHTHDGPGIIYAGLLSVAQTPEQEWRWLYDRNSLLLESEEAEARFLAARLLEDERLRDRQQNITYERLLSEPFLPNWSRSPEYPPTEFTLAVRDRLRKACEELQKLGDRPHRRDVRRIIKATVIWLNEVNRIAGDVIETDKRADLTIALEDLIYAAKQGNLVEEIETWRSW